MKYEIHSVNKYNSVIDFKTVCFSLLFYFILGNYRICNLTDIPCLFENRSKYSDGCRGSQQNEKEFNLSYYLNLDDAMVAHLHTKQEIQGSSPDSDSNFSFQMLIVESL